MTSIVFLDCETVGLDPRLHGPWEIAVITYDTATEVRTSRSWLVRPDLTYADPQALGVNNYYERTRRAGSPGAQGQADRWADPREVAAELAPLIAKQVIAGSNTAFDERMLAPWMSANGQVWTAHYRHVDVPTLGAGVLLARGEVFDPQVSSRGISRAFGVDPDSYDRHTALGDCEWMCDLYVAITAGGAR
jgi:DNA polymerase III epsilon subunit-like protein